MSYFFRSIEGKEKVKERLASKAKAEKKLAQIAKNLDTDFQVQLKGWNENSFEYFMVTDKKEKAQKLMEAVTDKPETKHGTYQRYAILENGHAFCFIANMK